MREIIFRGKSGTEWVYGDLWRLHEGRVAIRRNDKVLPYEVIPETVGQYTGLMDKNGGMIFEGDIFDLNREIYFVFFDDKTAQYRLKNNNGGELWLHAFNSISNVIGNIHDGGINDSKNSEKN